MIDFDAAVASAIPPSKEDLACELRKLQLKYNAQKFRAKSDTLGVTVLFLGAVAYAAAFPVISFIVVAGIVVYKSIPQPISSQVLDEMEACSPYTDSSAIMELVNKDAHAQMYLERVERIGRCLAKGEYEALVAYSNKLEANQPQSDYAQGNKLSSH